MILRTLLVFHGYLLANGGSYASHWNVQNVGDTEHNPMKSLGTLLLAVPISNQLQGSGLREQTEISSQWSRLRGGFRSAHDLRVVDAIVSLQTQLPGILTDWPFWDAFDQGFTIIDETGSKVKGLAYSQMLLKLLQEVYSKLACNRAVEQNLYSVETETEIDERRGLFGTVLEPVLIARWSVHINSRCDPGVADQLGLSRPHLEGAPAEDHLEGTSRFRFTADGKIASMEILSHSVNGIRSPESHPLKLKSLEASIRSILSDVTTV